LNAHQEQGLEECVAEYAGSRVKTLCMPSLGIYLCPLCISSEQAPMFLTAKDLMHHLLAHAKGLVKPRSTPHRHRARPRNTLMSLGSRREK
jgi:hypothetical protein